MLLPENFIISAIGVRNIRGRKERQMQRKSLLAFPSPLKLSEIKCHSETVTTMKKSVIIIGRIMLSEKIAAFTDTPFTR